MQFDEKCNQNLVKNANSSLKKCTFTSDFALISGYPETQILKVKVLGKVIME